MYEIETKVAAHMPLNDLPSTDLNRIAPVLAVCATLVSVSIALCAGWQRGGTIGERVIGMALAIVAVLLVHVTPMWWSRLKLPVRVVAVALWGIGLYVVASGQSEFLLVAQAHAGNVRAASVPVLPVPVIAADVRGPVQIARDIAAVRSALARAQSVECRNSCPALTARKATLAAQLAALNVEADEAKRRETVEDRIMTQVNRNDALRDSLRVDPVVSDLAHWLGVTEATISMSLAVASAVVLEGAAILGWLAAGVAPGRGGCRVSRVDTHPVVAASRDDLANVAEADDAEASAPPPETDAASMLTDNELAVEHIHAAVRAGQITATQRAIRAYLGCGQQRAGYLNRLYRERFYGSAV